jgi:ATP-binding cassette subfamily B protein
VFPKFGLIQSLTDRLNNVTREELNGVRVIRAFNAENFAEGKFKKVNGDTTKINIFTSKVMNSSFPAVFLLMNILILSIY